jgi:hypothetical protein
MCIAVPNMLHFQRFCHPRRSQDGEQLATCITLSLRLDASSSALGAEVENRDFR